MVPVVNIRKILLEEPVLDGRQGQRSLDQPLFSLRNRGRATCGGQLGNRLVVKHLFGSELKACLAGSSDDLNADHGIPAQFEKVILNAHLLDAKQLLPDVGKGLLNLVSGRDIKIS